MAKMWELDIKINFLLDDEDNPEEMEEIKGYVENDLRGWIVNKMEWKLRKTNIVKIVEDEEDV